MVRRIVILSMLLTSIGFAASRKQQEAELAQLGELLPGRYTNLAQVKADEEAGREPHAALEVNIVPVYAPRVSEYAYYVQESAADDPRRIFTQRFIALKVVKGRGIVESLWSFAEPLRWRDAHRNKDLFKSMTSQDLVEMDGCDILWIRKNDKSGFEGANEASSCRVSSEAAGSMVRLKMRVEITADELVLSEESFDSAGRPIQPGGADSVHRYQRR